MNPKTCFAYTRVSTVKQGDGVSLEAQREAIGIFAQKNNLTITDWFEEKETAAKRGRPIFDTVVKSLQSGKAAGLIVHKIDRSARNFADWARIGDLVDNGIDVHFAHESLDLRSRGGRLTADIQAVIAADYVRNLREETIKGIEGRLKQGLFPFGAPIGYLNTGPGKAKTPDPMRAPFVRQAFELYASQQFSLRGLVCELEKRGLRNRHGKPVTKYGVENILKNRFYYGTIYLKRADRMYNGIHEPIVTKALFDRVQALKGDRHHKKQVVHNHRYRRLFSCALCNRRLYGEVQKGHVYMRCQTKGCPTTTIRQDRIEAKISSALLGLRLPKRDDENLKAQMRKRIEQRNEASDLKAIQLQLHQLDLREHQLTDALIERLIDKRTFQSRKDQIDNDRQDLEKNLKESGNIAKDQRTAERFLELIKSLYFTYQIADSAKKRRITEIMFSNRSISGKNLCLTPQNWCVQVDDTMGVLCGGPDRTTSRIKERVREALEVLDDDWNSRS
ncbi:MAG: recombinase family protein [Rhodobacteraceae bacterium]|nr:recombinase family protein [Paracoccaceae bacterium]